MPVSGIVLTLTEDRVRREDALRHLAADGRDLCEALIDLPGVDQLEVAYVAAEDEPASTAEGAST